MVELTITNEMRSKINDYLGYELIKEHEVGHQIYDEAPGLGRIGIEGNELQQVVTNKQLDSNGNIEWYKTPHPKAKPGEIKPFHCKLTTVSSKKAKILIASLFPEEAIDDRFMSENYEVVQNLRSQLNLIKAKRKVTRQANKNTKLLPNKTPMMNPNQMLMEGASCYMMIEKN